MKETQFLELVSEHFVTEVHVQLGPSEKCAETSKVYHSIALKMEEGTVRVVFFTTKKLRNYWYAELLELQGYPSPIDQYKLGKLPLQRGSESTVLHGIHKVINTLVVVKTVEKSELTEDERDKFSPRPCLKSEANTLYRCRHPSVIKCIEFFETDESFSMVTESYEGGDLWTYMTNRNIVTFNENILREIAKRIAEGL